MNDNSNIILKVQNTKKCFKSIKHPQENQLSTPSKMKIIVKLNNHHHLDSTYNRK